MILAGALEGALIGAAVGAVVGLIFGLVKMVGKKREGGNGKPPA